jgi:CMP-N-acetylneuraminic acid synthetase
LIIIDDGSTDNTAEILERYRNSSRIRIVEQKNKGLNVSNNIAIRLSNAKYIVRLDADDYMDENMLLVLTRILDNKPEVGLVYPDYFHVDENGNVLELVRRKKIGEEVELLDLPAHGACTMFRKEVLLELGGYSEEYTCQDGYDIWLRAIKSHQPYNVNVPLFYYRQHSASLTKNEEKILATRRRIKRRFVEAFNGGDRPRVLGIVPVVSRPAYPQAGPFVQVAGRPLLQYALQEASVSGHLDRLVLAADEEQVLEYGSSFEKVEPVLRPKELSKSSSRMEDIVGYVLKELRKRDGYDPDCVCLLYVNTPLRRAYHIDKAIDTLTVFEVDTVLSVQEELAFCYHHEKLGLKRISNCQRNIRMERDAIYKENGAIYLSRVHVIEKGHLLGEKIGHIVMLPWEGIRITDAYSLWVAEKTLSEWAATRSPVGEFENGSAVGYESVRSSA